MEYLGVVSRVRAFIQLSGGGYLLSREASEIERSCSVLSVLVTVVILSFSQGSKALCVIS